MANERAQLTPEIAISSYASAPVHYQELRISMLGGGPRGLEFIVKADVNGTELAVWNPWRNEWATVALQGSSFGAAAADKAPK